MTRVTGAWRSVAAWLLTIVTNWSSHCGQRHTSLAARVDEWHVLSHTWRALPASRHAQAFLRWRKSLTIEVMRSRRVVELLTQAVRVLAEQAASHDARKAEAHWKAWIVEGPGKGLARRRWMSRCATGWIPATLSPTPAAPEVDGELVDAEATEVTEA